MIVNPLVLSDIDLTNHWGMCSDIRCEISSTSSTDVSLTRTASELVGELRSRKWYPTRFTLVQSNPPGSWWAVKVCGLECVLIGRDHFQTHLLTDGVSLEGQFDGYGFHRCFAEWVSLRFLVIVDDNEFLWVTIGNGYCVKKAFFSLEGVRWANALAGKSY